MEATMKTLQTTIAVAVVALLATFSLVGNRLLGEDNGHGGPAVATVDAKQTLRQDMRKLWTDHTVWTRMYVIAAVGGYADKDAAAGRLLKNQEDIGDAVGAYYGEEAGNQLTDLLKEHITIAVELIDAAKAGNTQKFEKANAEWKRNAADISAFLAKANPNWPEATLVEMMNSHLSTTIDEVQARLDKDWDADVKAYEEVYEHILAMADTLSDGIIKQFPDKFKG
jgi:hypothetical protein